MVIRTDMQNTKYNDIVYNYTHAYNIEQSFLWQLCLRVEGVLLISNKSECCSYLISKYSAV